MLVGTLQLVDPTVHNNVTAYAEWPVDFPETQPLLRVAKTLRRGEIVLVVWESSRSALVRVLSSQGLLFMSSVDFHLPGFMGCEEVPWVVEQHEKEWYFRSYERQEENRASAST
jgi:hypothetical protein